MSVSYTFDIFSSLDGYSNSMTFGGYFGKQGPELLGRRFEQYGEEQRLVLGANTYRALASILGVSEEESLDPWVARMKNLPTTVVSNSLEGESLNWPDASVLSGDAVEAIAQLKKESDVPLRSHGSLTLNRALLAAGLVDRVQVTLFPVITGKTGLGRIFEDAAAFDLELIEHSTLDNHTQELIYRPTLHP